MRKKVAASFHRRGARILKRHRLQERGLLRLCVRNRHEPIAPVEVAHRTVTMCHLANVAMLLRRKVRWDPAGETFPGDEQANRMPMIRRARREPWTF